MSQMTTQAVLTCSRCRNPYVLSELRTSIQDPDLKLLQSLMTAFARNGLCPDCKRKAKFEAELKLKGVQTDYHVRPQTSTTAVDPHYYQKQLEERRRILGR
jgi:hypothetical protein